MRRARSPQARALAGVLGLHLFTEAVLRQRPRPGMPASPSSQMKFMAQPRSTERIDDELREFAEALAHCPVEPMLSRIREGIDDALDARNAVRAPVRLPLPDLEA